MTSRIYLFNTAGDLAFVVLSNREPRAVIDEFEIEAVFQSHCEVSGPFDPPSRWPLDCALIPAPQ